MSTATDQKKSELLDRATEVATHRKGSGGPPADEVGSLLSAYYRHVASDDVCERTDVDLYAALASQYRLAENRPQGRANVHVFTPSHGDNGWSAGGHSVVEIVTDDMSFLVDSVTMELSRQQREMHLVIHPQFDVVRDITGVLQSVQPIKDETKAPADDALRESWMHIEIGRLNSEEDPHEIEEALQRVLRDVRESVEDWPKMRAHTLEIVEELAEDPPPLDAEQIERGRALLQWLADDHFAYLGYREYRLEREGDDEILRAVPGTGLGILRADHDQSRSFAKLPDAAKAKAREKTLLVLSKANSRATVHRPAYLDYVGVKTFDEAGEVTGERRFLGLLSSAAYTESITRIPLLREKAAEVLARIGVEPRSHAGKSLMDTLETYPRDEIFHTPAAELAAVTQGVLQTVGRRQLKVFVRRETYGRYVSVLCYLPRDRYNTAVRERFSQILLDRFHGDSIEFNVKMSESTTARVHFVVHPPLGSEIPDVDAADLERLFTEASRSWRDDFITATVAEYGEERGARLARKYADSFPEAYKEDFSATTAALDVGRLEGIEGDLESGGGIDLSLFSPLDAGRGEARLKVFRIGNRLSLSQVLPMLTSMGVEVLDERPYELDDLDQPTFVYEFGLHYPPGSPTSSAGSSRTRSGRSGTATTRSTASTPWCWRRGSTWRQATVLRAYAKYMKQGNSPFAVDYIEAALHGNTDIARLLWQLFEARFDPGKNGLDAQAEARTARVEELEERIKRALDDVASLDHDRILRSYLTHIRATLRTNYFQAEDGAQSGGSLHRYISFKLEPSAIPDLPEPRPRYEIFVYSPRVEGVHLRFGAVARGGLRWSDRRDDFRTEVLGLVKAQMVKNTVIVPVGAKGGFFCKQLPDPGDREAWLAEGVACYRTFISGLLDITDNRRRRRDRAAARRGPPRRRRLLPGGGRRQGHGDVQRHRQRRGQGLRLLARRRLRERRVGGLRPQGHGHHGPGRLGLGPPPLPRAGRRLPDRELHGGRHRRHVRRRVRQRDAVLRAHQAGGRVRPPRHLPRPDARRRDVVRRAEAPLRPPALLVAGLRQEPDLRGRRGLPPEPQGDQGDRAGAPRARHRGRRTHDDPGRADAGRAQGAGRPALERRHRDVRQGGRRDKRRRRRQGQRHDPRRRPRAAGPVRRRGRQPRPDPARPHRVRRARADASTPTSSTTPPASTPPTTR